LEECDDCIGKVFLELAPYLKFYSTYANDFESAVKLVFSIIKPFSSAADGPKKLASVCPW
jgi:hypothetical protein